MFFWKSVLGAKLVLAVVALKGKIGFITAVGTVYYFH
jgi:hypothetical protein